MRAEADRDEGEIAHEVLQERELHLERVLAGVRSGVFGEQLRALHERVRQRRVYAHVAQRRAPRALAVDCGEMSEAGVIRAEDDEALRQFRREVERRGDVAAVHQPRMRHDAADETFLRRGSWIGGHAGCHLIAEAIGARLVERAGDGGRADFHPITLSHPAAQAHSLPL